ncbi:hypothetical protein ACKWTF_003502 [Chironomus riparius]
MKSIFILSIALAVITVQIDAKKLHKCYYLITKCPRPTIPCPMPSICINGTLRHQDGGCCCIPQCEENEVFYERAPITADPTCDVQTPFPSMLGGRSGCFCKSGYVRNKENKCVHIDECPKPITACHKNETYSECGQIASCEATCSKPLPYDMMCPAICKKGCYCKDRYVRNKNRKCILLEDCPDPECGENEEFLKRYQLCTEPTCEHPRTYYCGQQYKKGCFCQKGYVRNKEKKCIKLEECPNEPHQHEL